MARSILTVLHAAFLCAGFIWMSLAHAAPDAPGLQPQARTYQQYFQEAAEEFDVPVELLQGIAYVETRWQPIVPKGYAGKMPEHGVEAEAHHGKPPGYGIMGLHDDAYFGHSLAEAARLIGLPAARLQADMRANVRGAAALLAKYGGRLTRASPLEAWESALARFSGIPQRDVAQLYTYEIFAAIAQGRRSDQFLVQQRPVDLEKIYGKQALKKLSAN